VQVLPAYYLQARNSMWQTLQSTVAALQPLLPVLAYDALLILDKVAALSLVNPDLSNTNQIVAASLLVIFQSAPQAPGSPAPPDAASLSQHLQVEESAVDAAAERVRSVLQDASLMSSYRVATLLLETLVSGQVDVQVCIHGNEAGM
jgi:hypothetical protein